MVEELAYTAPHLFFEANMIQFKNELDELAAQREVSPYDSRNIKLVAPLDYLNQLKQKGPGSDFHYAQVIHRALVDNPPEYMNQGWFWSSINCFVLSSYVSMRWDSALRRSNPGKFVKRHWLWIGSHGRLWNGSARLWWLASTLEGHLSFPNIRRKPFSQLWPTTGSCILESCRGVLRSEIQLWWSLFMM